MLLQHTVQMARRHKPLHSQHPSPSTHASVRPLPFPNSNHLTNTSSPTVGVLSFIFLICSLRTNLMFVLIFLGATLGFLLAAASFWTTAMGMSIGANLLVGTGAAFFFAACVGWYLLAAIMFAVLDMPFGLPVVDLSTTIKGASERAKRD